MQIKSKQVLVAIAAKHHGDYGETVGAINNNEPISDEEIAKYSHLCKSALTVLDENWPNAWKHDPMHPFVVFVKCGSFDLFSPATDDSVLCFDVTFASTKKPNNAVLILDDGKEPLIGRMIFGIISAGHLIVVPNFETGDIMVENEGHFAIITEFLDGCYDKNNAEHIRRVAHAAAGLCDTVLVGYGTPKSGVSCAVDSIRYRDGKIFAVPAGIGSDNSINNSLLEEDASIALSCRDIIMGK